MGSRLRPRLAKSKSNNILHFHPHRRFPDSRCRIPDSRFQIADSIIQNPHSRIQIHDSIFQIPELEFHIPDLAPLGGSQAGRCDVESTILRRCDVELVRARRKPDDSSTIVGPASVQRRSRVGPAPGAAYRAVSVGRGGLSAGGGRECPLVGLA